MSKYWLLKTEPETYSFQDLLKDKKTNWDGVRNFQARNHLLAMKNKDVALIYHSGDERAVIGIAQVVREAYPNPDPKRKGEWVQVDLVPIEKLAHSVSLKDIKAESSLKDLTLVKQSRLSVMPVNKTHYQKILKMAEATQNK